MPSSLQHLYYCGRGGDTKSKGSNASEEEWDGFDEDYVDYDNFEYSSEEEEPAFDPDTSALPRLAHGEHCRYSHSDPVPRAPLSHCYIWSYRNVHNPHHTLLTPPPRHWTQRRRKGTRGGTWGGRASGGARGHRHRG